MCENETPNPVVLGEVSVTAGNDVNKKNTTKQTFM
jgi:hypothetical protein